jgi:hypothetical protein
MIFNWVVRHIGFLKHIPLLAMMFDGWMMMWNALQNPEVLAVIDRIETTAATWNGIELSIHKFGGLQFNYRDKEVGHIHSNGILDILFPRKVSSTLIADKRANEHHIFNTSGWISFYIRDAQDYDAAIALLQLSYEYRKRQRSS